MADAGIQVLTGGTDVHLVLVDLRDSELDGKAAEDRLHSIGITVNRNAVPFDPRPPMVTSGLRIGTPALATRGFTDRDFVEVADIIATALIAPGRRARPGPAGRPAAPRDRAGRDRTRCTRAGLVTRRRPVRIEKLVTSGTFSLDGGTWDVDNNVWLVGDDDEVLVIDAAHDADAIKARSARGG